MRNIIFGMDWWTDCDDCVAARLLTRAHKRGEIKLLGVVMNACAEDSVRSLDAFLALDGCPDIPIGIDLSGTDFGGKLRYQQRLAALSRRYERNEAAEDGVRLYRRLLAEADAPVEMIEVGFLQTVAALLRSEGDDISAESGRELVAKKVKRMWVMAGKWDADGEREHNFTCNARAIAGGADFLELCPVPVTFLGWEVGHGVLTGGDILDTGDHLRAAMQDHGSSRGRDSWDPMLTLLALIGDEEKAGYRTVSGTARLDRTDGSNYFTEGEGLHSYVIKAKPDSYYQDEINRLIKDR